MWYISFGRVGFFLLSRRHVAGFPHRRCSFPLLHLSLNPWFQFALEFLWMGLFFFHEQRCYLCCHLGGGGKTGSCASALWTTFRNLKTNSALRFVLKLFKLKKSATFLPLFSSSFITTPLLCSRIPSPSVYSKSSYSCLVFFLLPQ